MLDALRTGAALGQGAVWRGADALRDMEDFTEQQRRESLGDTRFQSFEMQEASVVERMVREMPPGPARDAAIASAVSRSRAAGTTWLSSPMRSASSAMTSRPV